MESHTQFSNEMSVAFGSAAFGDVVCGFFDHLKN